MSYKNTTSEKGEVLEQYKTKAKSQDNQILSFFKGHKTGDYSPSEVHNILGLRCPLTSTRRSISSLTKDNLLEKTEKKVKGIYGRPEYTWKLSQGQQKLF